MLKAYGWKCRFLSASKDTKVLHLTAYKSQVLVVPYILQHNIYYSGVNFEAFKYEFIVQN